MATEQCCMRIAEAMAEIEAYGTVRIWSMLIIPMPGMEGALSAAKVMKSHEDKRRAISAQRRG